MPLAPQKVRESRLSFQLGSERIALAVRHPDRSGYCHYYATCAYSSQRELDISLKDMLKKAGVSSQQEAVALLMPGEYQLLTISKPAVPAKNLREAVRLAAAQKLSTPLSSSVFDYFPLPKVNNVGSDVAQCMVVSADQTCIRALLHACNTAGLRLMAVGIPELAYLRVIYHHQPALTTYALIRTTANARQLIVAHKQVLLTLSMLPKGPDTLTPGFIQSLASAIQHVIGRYSMSGMVQSADDFPIWVSVESSQDEQLFEMLRTDLTYPLQPLSLQDFISTAQVDAGMASSQHDAAIIGGLIDELG